MNVTDEDLIAYAEACLFTKDWDPIFEAAKLHSKRYRLREGQITTIGRRQCAKWAKRFLDDVNATPISWRAEE